jgi:SAM-dependent methyltransferase
MKKYNKLPVFDDSGINIADPHDTLGYKTDYISLVQNKALKNHIASGNGKVLDVGCGYGRMSDTLSELGYEVVGVEPSERVLEVARGLRPQHEWYVGKLPDLPFEKESFELVCLFNVARSLHLMKIADVCESACRYVKSGGSLIVIDNLRCGDNRFLEESWFEKTFTRDGLRLTKKIAIRSSRWPLIYLIRYGLVPRSLFNAVANWELSRMEKKKKIPRLSYYNYLFIFEKK